MMTGLIPQPLYDELQPQTQTKEAPVMTTTNA